MAIAPGHWAAVVAEAAAFEVEVAATASAATYQMHLLRGFAIGSFFLSDFKIKCLCGFTILFTSTHSDSCTKGSRAGELLKIIAAQTTLENKYIIPLIRVEPPTSCHSHGTLIPAKGPSARLLMKIKRFSSGRKYEGSERNEATAIAH